MTQGDFGNFILHKSKHEKKENQTAFLGSVGFIFAINKLNGISSIHEVLRCFFSVLI